MPVIKWIHFSDLHLNNDGMGTELLWDELPKFLLKSGIRCDYAFCTGDIRYAPDGAYPDDSAEYILSLCTAVHVPVENLFIVPGNHDVDANEGGRFRAVRKLHSKKHYDSRIGEISEEDLKTIYTGLRDFRTVLEGIYGKDSDRMEFYNNAGRPHFVIETEHFNILHVDSTISYSTGKYENGFVLGIQELHHTLKQLNIEKPTILLTHYAIQFLSQEERKSVLELLHNYNVRLWLAGHELEHNLMPYKYLYSIQAGQLRLEEKPHAIVLIGEYDSETDTGFIKAYSWFREGWTEYPYIWHDYEDENRFPFSLSLPGMPDGSSEAEICAGFNKQYMGNKILREIMPDIQTDYGRYSGDNPLVNLLEDLWQNRQKHTVLLADGGMGKTTLLLDTARLKSRQPILYIPLEWLSAQDLTIEKYICRILYKDETACDRLYRLTSTYKTQPDLILLLDGFNEVGETNESRFGKEICGLAQYPGLQIVVTSRENFADRYNLRFVKSSVCELLDGQIQKILTEQEWDHIQGEYALYELLKTPMLLLMYKQVRPLMECHREAFLEWIDPIENQTQLIHNYFAAQEAVLLERGNSSGEYLVKAMRCAGYALPYIGYWLENQNRMSIRRDEFDTIIEEAAEFANQCSYLHDAEKQLCRQYCMKNVPAVDSFDVEDYLINVMHLLHEEDESIFSFSHQMYRDYLSAQWLSKMFRHDAEGMWNQRLIPGYLHGYLREMNGRYWNGIAAELAEKARNREAKTIANLLANLLYVFPCTAESGTPDFTNIDFTGIRLRDYIAPAYRIPMKGAKISNVSLGLLKKGVKTYPCLELSEDFRKGGDYHALERGAACLKAAAISGDGRRAATLSQQTFGVFRCVQLWDLEEKRRTGECFVEQDIFNIHLSETGEWIIGERDDSYRIWNWENGKNSFELSGNLISNQCGRLATQGNKVLYKNSENILEVFDLETREFSTIENLRKNVRIADFLPNGELVVVGDNANKAILQSTRDGREMCLNSEDAAVTGIFCMKAQPFIGLTTSNQKLCFYYTGNGQCTRILDTASDNKTIAVHRSKDVVACSGGGNQFEIFRYFAFITDAGRNAGVWYQKPMDHKFYGDVLDMGFNEANEELVTIMSDGLIVYSHELDCKYHDSIQIITNINVNAYDFTGVLCSDEIRENLRCNGAAIRKYKTGKVSRTDSRNG